MRIVFYFYNEQLHCLHARTREEPGNETGCEALVLIDNDGWEEVACYSSLENELAYWKSTVIHSARKSYLVFQSLETALEYAIEHHPGRAVSLLAGLL